MASYKLEKKLYSYSVDKNLLKDIEGFILRKAREATGDKFEPSAYTIEIKDRLGAQTLASIDEYHYSQFPNDTESVELWYRSPQFTVLLRFSTAPYLTTVRIELSGEGPREQALGIWDSLEHLLDNYRTKHYLWQLHPGLDGALVGFIIVLFWVGPAILIWGIRNENPSGTNLGAYMIGVLLLIVLYLCGRYVYPYTTFDTRRNESRARIAKWYLGGIATFLLFGVIATYFRQKYLGF